MNRARRNKQKLNRRLGGGHSGTFHRHLPDPRHPGHFLPVNCSQCRQPSPLLPGTVKDEAARLRSLWGPRDWRSQPLEGKAHRIRALQATRAPGRRGRKGGRGGTR